MATEIMDNITMQRALNRITYEIIERNKGIENLVLIGVKTRGFYLAQRISYRLQQLENIDIPVINLDISQYRDDTDDVDKSEDLNPGFKEIDINNKNIILIDDVLYTGRTIRAALDAIIDNGRPQKISLAVLIDRGHRELPIRADFVGKNVPTSKKEKVKVHMTEIDDEDKIELS